MTMQPGKPSLLVKPTLDTKFHIDYEWWERSGEDLRAYLLTHLAVDKREALSQSDANGTLLDYVHPETGEVFELDEVGMALQEATKAPDFINPQTSLVDSVFRVFIANGNIPLSPNELATATGRDANTILKTLGSIKVYKGIRPIIAT